MIAISTPPSLSPSQLPLWLGQRLHPDRPHYNTAFAFTIADELDVGRCAQAWQAVVDGQPVLRSAFPSGDGRPVRTVLPPGSGAATTLDLREAQDPVVAFAEWADARARRPLALDGPLVDSVWVRLGPGQTGWYLNVHHLLTDAVSTERLFRAVGRAYAALETGDPITPEVTGLSPAVTDTAHRPPAAAEADQTYWKNQYERLRPVDFYGIRQEPRDTAAERRSIPFSASARERFEAVCGSDGFRSLFPEVSRFTAWATVLSAWLHRVSGQAEVGFLAPAKNRTASNRGALGLFMEMYPCVVEVDPRASFRDLGRRCAERTRDLLVHAGTGASASTAERVESNVVLNVFASDLSRFAGRPCSARWLHPGHVDAVRPVRLQVYDLGGKGHYTVALDLNTEAFPPAARARAEAHFEAVLDAFLENPDAEIGAVDILTVEERSAQLEAFNRPAPAPLPAQTVVARFRAQVARTPDALALQEGDRSVTFGALAAEVDRWCSALAAESDRRPVALWLPRSIETIACLLGALAAGRPYIPIDASAPPARVRQILKTSGASCLLTSASLAGRLPAGAWTVCEVEDGPTPPSGGSAPVPDPALEDLAYIIFTSGSTGLPKGVPITHAGLADYLDWADRQYVRGDRLTFALFTSLAFDLTVTSLFLPLLTGNPCHLYPDQEGPVDGAFLAMMEDNVAELIKLTPSHLRLMRQYDLTRSRVRRMILGGEDLRAELARGICRQLGDGVELYNEYGPTEAVVGCMIHRFSPDADAGSPSVPIGRPADHVRLYVTNPSLQLVPTGVPGELCVARHGLTPGYVGDPALSEGRFLADPWQPGERLYRTGDRVRFLDPETLDYLGRLDRQVKVSGHRIELREIEQAVEAIEGITACVVLPHAAAPGGNVVAAATGPGCVRCGLPRNYPGATFDEAGVCQLCRSFEQLRDKAEAYFRPSAEFKERILAKRGSSGSEYDCMHLLSGGKDSTFALCKLVEMGLRVYTFTLDNGYISEEAKANIRRVVETLGVRHEFGSTPAMKEIFRDSLETFSNVCQGCFKTIYTLGMSRARELRIPFVVTGLSRGQFFETRLTPDLFRGGRFSVEAVDRATLEARKVYHRIDDAVKKHLDVRAFQDGAIFEEVEVIDFFRYHEASLTEMIDHLTATVPWVRPSDTGRSTNCLINDAGIYIHQRERGFHNYALPYSWDVRMGHKTREEAVDELNDEIDVNRVRQILREVGYPEDRLAGSERTAQLVGFVVAPKPPDPETMAARLAETLPRAMIPQRWIAIDEIPLARSGKVDTKALAARAAERDGAGRDRRMPDGPVEERVAEAWQAVLAVESIGADESFFSLGGASLAAMEVTIRLCREFDLTIELQTIFQHPTVAAFAAVIEELLLAEIEGLTEEEAVRLLEGGAKDE